MAKRTKAYFKGDWDKTFGWLNGIISGKITREVGSYVGDIGKEVKNAVVAHIMSQDIPWKKLADITIYKKGHGKKYLDTHTFVQAIVSEIVKSSDGFTVTVYPKGTAENGLDLSKLAYYLEMGTSRGLPSRPLWRRTVQEVVSGRDSKVNKTLEEVAKRYANV